MVEYSMFGDKNKMLRGDKNDNKKQSNSPRISFQTNQLSKQISKISKQLIR